jgi:hypothetical protein
MDEQPDNIPRDSETVRRVRDAMRETREDPRICIEDAPRIPVSNPEARLVREVLARHQRELTELAMEMAQDRGIDTTRYTLQSRPTGIAWELNPASPELIRRDGDNGA